MKAISTAFFILWASIAFAQPYQFKTIAVPDAVHTVSMGINDLGDVVGASFDSLTTSSYHPFLYSDGQYFDLVIPGGNHMQANAINRDGTIVGTFNLFGTGLVGFVMDDQNTTFMEKTDLISVSGISNRDVVVGWRSQGAINQLGYLYKNGVFIQPVTPAEVPNIDGSAITGVNGLGDSVGFYYFATGPGTVTRVSFIRTKAGQLNPVGGGDFLPIGINNDGVMVGLSGAGNDGAILEDGVVTLIKYPGADYTGVHAINNKGMITGYYTKAGVYYGFVGKPQPLPKRDLRLK